MRRWSPAAAFLSSLLSLSACSRHEARLVPPNRPQAAAKPPSVVLADAGHARVVIVAPERLAPHDETPQTAKKKRRRPRPSAAEKLAAAEQKRLRASIEDLAVYLEKLSGARVEVSYGKAPRGQRLPILIGELAQERFGDLSVKEVGRQGFRIAVQPAGIGLYGESDLATSYAIYELLDRLGCRWFMPGELGEEIPSRSRLELPLADDSLKPATLYRSLWYADEAYKRRNRLGGVRLAAGHKLETWISDEQRSEHPEWRAVIRGSPHPRRLRWSNPAVAVAIADAIDAQLAKKPAASVSLSPNDGSDFDETLDSSLDANDWDPSTNTVSLTDRLMVLAGRVADRLTPRHPELMLGLLAYATYTRPPVRERVHPNVVPVIAPITYCRSRPWSDDRCPGASDARRIVEGWSARSRRLAFRGYLFNLAEPAAPNPMLRKQSNDLPYLLSHRISFYQPETLPSFETNLPALYLGVRLAWDARRSPAVELNELFERFYGHAGTAVRTYLELIDAAWVDTAEFSGGALGHARRFPEPFLKRARELLDVAKRACKTRRETERVALLDESLAQLELYMKNVRNFGSGRLETLARDHQSWLERAGELSLKYAENSAFGKAGRWAGPRGVYAYYADRFISPAYAEVERIRREHRVLTAQPLCRMSYELLPNASLPLTAPPQVAGKMHTDVCTETWSSLGQHDYFGAMGYEAVLDVESSPHNRAKSLWLSRIDGVAQVWVNGQLVPVRDTAHGATGEAHLKSLTFDVSSALRPGESNRITVVVRRTRLVELGGGGLLGPIYLYE